MPKNSVKGALELWKGIIGLSFITCVVEMFTTTGESLLGELHEVPQPSDRLGRCLDGVFGSFQKFWVVWFVRSSCAVNAIPAIIDTKATSRSVLNPALFCLPCFSLRSP